MHNNNERYIISDLNKKIEELTKKKNEFSIHIKKSNNDDDSEPNIERKKRIEAMIWNAKPIPSHHLINNV